jgi:phenylalanyl-tRNA synthetase beta chain
MNISLSWLKKYIDLKGIDPKELGLKLTLSTVEVEEVKNLTKNLDGVVVGELLSIKKHPDADKLSIASVDVGEESPRQIVFGQMVEMKVGDKIPVALAPTVLPLGQEIKKSKLRGEISEGMLCLDQELGFLEEGVSIQFFDKKNTNGSLITEIMGLDDSIYDIDNKSLTNRPDLWGHYGMAREVAAIYDKKFKDYELKKFNTKKEVKLQVDVKDQELCPRYLGVVMSGVKVGESPDWLKKNLQSIGQKPINNIVDITNYILHDLGQPLHAFSADRIEDNHIIVRTAKEGEKFTTLDGGEHKLLKTDLVIYVLHRQEL